MEAQGANDARWRLVLHTGMVAPLLPHTGGATLVLHTGGATLVLHTGGATGAADIWRTAEAAKSRLRLRAGAPEI